MHLSNGDDNSKQMVDQSYHWCIKHQIWTVHTPDKCTLPPLTRNKPKIRSNTSFKLEDDLQVVIEEVDSEDE